MSIENEPSMADGQRKIEDQTHDNINKSYNDFLKKEQEALDAKLKGEATARFDEVRKLGFSTQKDVETQIQGIFGKFVTQLEDIKKENAALREWVMRAKVQGLNAGAVEDQKQPSTMDKWRRAW